MNYKKYKLATWVDLPNRQWPGKVVKKAPIWCSVDLRDGNQALAVPMSVGEKLDLYKTLVKVGFKEIEVGFPSASDTEYNFLRKLVNDAMIPEDVTVQVLTQSREQLIRKTFESLKGVKNAIVHLYNSTSERQRRITFGNKSRDEIKEIALNGVRLVRELADEAKKNGTNIRLEYSPESFSDTELDFALEICEAVKDVWKPTTRNKIILNLPETVQYTTPNIHADQIEWMCSHISEREKVIISVHTHNDRGTGVAAAELAMMAGADRLEGTLFGNGERTGNLDLVTVALNLLAQGVDPKLDLSNLPAVREAYERNTHMEIHPRHPYAGDLVFTAFSGSHQDAIKKGMACRLDGGGGCWEVPYLHIDPKDIGRDYEAIIRINSQSGKGGVAYILQQDFGFDIPKLMQPDVGNFINAKADALGKELSPDEISEIFKSEFVNRTDRIVLHSYKMSSPDNDDHVKITAKITVDGKNETITASGNGPINAFMNALELAGLKNFNLTDYRSHAIGLGSASDSAAYICLFDQKNGKHVWGAGLDSNIEFAGLKALICAANRIATDNS